MYNIICYNLIFVNQRRDPVLERLQGASLAGEDW
jgi:hypothetical protein